MRTPNDSSLLCKLRFVYLFVINATHSTCLGAAGQIKRLVFDPPVHPNEGMGNSTTGQG